MALSDWVNVGDDLDFQKKCKLLFIKAAVAVASEDETTANHAARLAFAKQVLYGTISSVQLAYAVLTNTTIQGKINADEDYDSDLEYVVNSVYDSFALTGAV